jgi:hypothetical protein
MNNIKTGDIILTSWVNPIGTLVKWITYSNYHHVEIAVCIDPTFLPAIKIIKKGGILCFLGTNKGSKYKKSKNNTRYYIYLKKYIHGNPVNIITRSLKVIHKNTDFLQKCINYISSNVIEYEDETKIMQITKFLDTTDTKVPLTLKDNLYPLSNFTNGFCSEITFSFYKYCLGNLINNENIIYLPKHFLEPHLNNIFDKEIVISQKASSNLNFIYDIIFIILVIFLLIIIYYIYKYFKK